MKKRIRISIDEELIKQVNDYARIKNKTVSVLAEEYFKQLSHLPIKTNIIEMIEGLERPKIIPSDLSKAYHLERASKMGF